MKATKQEPGMYRSPYAIGVCANVSPYGLAATELLDALEPQITVCDMPDCDEEAVRVGVFAVMSPGDDAGDHSEFRGLCERHKRVGQFNGAWE